LAISYTGFDINNFNTMHKTLPPFKYLVTFDAAARLGSFSKASEELSLTQSAISQQLIKLEEILGQSLFFRNGKGVSLTAAGELLHETVRDTLARLETGIGRIEPYKSSDSVLIVCPPDFAHGWLMPRLGKLKLMYPNIEVWVMTEKEVREIDRIDVDLIISRRPIHTADVECVPLLEDASIAICGVQTAHRIANLPYPKLLEHAPVLLLESEPAWDGRLSGDAFKEIKLTRGATIEDSRILLDAVIHELGIGFVSNALAQQAIKEGKVRVLTQIPSKSLARLWLMRSRLAPRTPVANEVFNWLLDKAITSSQ
jgi:LysR family transcriptional regulator, glycine cleavage system transcriptional activator